MAYNDWVSVGFVVACCCMIWIPIAAFISWAITAISSRRDK